MVLSFTTGLVSTIFLIWAAVNYATKHFDLGVYTFSLALGASCYGGGCFDRCLALKASTYRIVAVSAYGSVAANYILGLFVASGRLLLTYFTFGAAVWALATLEAGLIAREGALSGDDVPPYSRL